jgi:sorting nexin-3/12
MTTTHSATARIQAKQQTLEDAYSPPANFLEIDIADPQTHGVSLCTFGTPTSHLSMT